MLLITLIFISITFGFYIYKLPLRKTVQTQVHSSNYHSNTRLCSDYSSENINKLKVNLIHNMTKGYKDNQLASIKRSQKDDAHSIWFDLETLKKFIYHIEYKSSLMNRGIKELGLRFYYSRYPAQEPLKIIGIVYSKN